MALKTLQPRLRPIGPRIRPAPDPEPRGESQEWKQWYTHSRWRRLRRSFLDRNPLCRMCEDRGQFAIATVVDHIQPHRGDRGLFWDERNWQPLCKTCHDSTKQAMDRGGR